MTQPRMCLKGTTYQVTRTCQSRRFLLTPSALVNATILYCLSRVASVLGVEVHSVSVQANHMHLVVTDFEGCISRFMQQMDRLIAVCLVAYYRGTHPNEHLDGIWAKGHFNAVALLNREAVLKALVYVFTNPTKDGQVPDYRKWPGLSSRPADWAREVRYAERPELFFNQEDRNWVSVPYRFTVPPMLRDTPVERLIEDVEALVRQEQAAIRATMAQEGRSFRGVKAVLRQDPFDSPNSSRPKGKVSPTVAAGGDGKLLQEGKRLVRSFRELYREAWHNYVSGAPALFPAGTLKMREHHHVPCDVVDAPWCIAALTPS